VKGTGGTNTFDQVPTTNIVVINVINVMCVCVCPLCLGGAVLPSLD
jgi:hypothetical protein